MKNRESNNNSRAMQLLPNKFYGRLNLRSAIFSCVQQFLFPPCETAEEIERR